MRTAGREKQIARFFVDLYPTLLEVCNPTFRRVQHELDGFFGFKLAKLDREMLGHIRSLPYSDPIANRPYFLVTAIAGKRTQAM